MKRRLTAILAADVVGYSAMMAGDEAGTLALLRAHRKELFDPEVARWNGRIVKLMGDGVLVEFPSVVDAVECAIAVQTALAEGAGKIRLRIGVNLGDVISDGDDIYGDGVNVAARLEALAEPGGICISSIVKESVGNRVEAEFAEAGEHEVKGIPHPIRIWRWPSTGTAVGAQVPPQRQKRDKAWLVASAAATLLIGVGGLGVWHFALRDPAPMETEQPITKAAARPLIAVLPFDDYGGDAPTQRLAKGVTEDIITDLARFPEFGVLARNATEAYANKPVDAREVGKRLAANYVLEGSIQRDGDRLRVGAQLIDSGTGTHLWAERWDRPADDIFAIQSEIAETVANRIGGGAGIIQQAGRSEARRKRPEDLDAYDYYLLGTEQLEQVTRESIEDSIRLLHRAVELDPGLARAWVELFHAHNLSRYYGVDRGTALAAARSAAEKAMQLDPSDPEAHATLAMALMNLGERARAKVEFDTALRMAPSSFEILAFYASAAGDFGEAERGAELAERAIELNPSFPMWAASPFAWAFFAVGRYEDALRMLDRLAPESYATWRWAVRAGSLAMLGRSEEAAAAVRQALSFYPELTIETLLNDLGLADIERDRWIETMRLAGFPACAPAAERDSLAKEIRLPECEGAATSSQ